MTQVREAASFFLGHVVTNLAADPQPPAVAAWHRLAREERAAWVGDVEPHAAARR